MKENKLNWRRLDNSAKLFPITSNKKFSTVFRISAILKFDIEQEILQTATEKVLNCFSSFKVKLQKGFFWYYLEYNPKIPIVEKEQTYPCKYIDRNTNNGYLFKVSYYKNKINLDMFHSLTDGNSATEFLKAIIYKYIDIKNNLENYSDNNIKVEDGIDINNTEDSYIKNYIKNMPNRSKNNKAYILNGKKLPLYSIGVTHEFINLKQVVKYCRANKYTVTQYLTALLIYAIYKGNYQKYNGKRPIKICIPVNLKKYFESTTISNFFSFITIEANRQNCNFDDFSDILRFVKEDFHKKLTKEEITKTMSNYVSLGTNFFIRIIPLFLKKVIIKISYMVIRKYTTTTLSNIGKIHVMPEYEQYIENFLLLIAPEKGEKIKCAVCTYGDYINFGFTSILQEQDIQNEFENKLKSDNIPVKTKTNDVFEEKNSDKLYSKIVDVKKSKMSITILSIISIMVAITTVILNICIKSPFNWSIIAVGGIVYVWVTTLYSISKNVNIASHVMFQTIVTTILCLIIDYAIGYSGWSLEFAFPIIVITANVTLTCLFIVNHKKYIKYIIYHLIVFVLSLIPIFLLLLGTISRYILPIISTVVAVVTLDLSIIFSGKQIKQEILSRFHI